MNLEKIGMLFRKNTRPRVWWIKLGVALILSNVFFFYLFTNEKVAAPVPLQPGMVEVQLKPEFRTPFQEGKKVLLIHRQGRIQISAVLKKMEEADGTLTVLVSEETAAALFTHSDWEILPHLKKFFMPLSKTGVAHEIRY